VPQIVQMMPSENRPVSKHAEETALLEASLHKWKKQAWAKGLVALGEQEPELWSIELALTGGNASFALRLARCLIDLLPIVQEDVLYLTFSSRKMEVVYQPGKNITQQVSEHLDWRFPESLLTLPHPHTYPQCHFCLLPIF
jgi:transposase-like protein